MSRVLIIGGGASGMYASIEAAKNGHEVQLFEKNEKLGKKLYLTGKGRCNLTNTCDMDMMFASVMHNPKFLYSSFYGCTNQDVIDFFENAGMPTKTERGGRVFPVSDHSSDVIKALTRQIKDLGIKVNLETEVRDLLTDNDHFSGLRIRSVRSGKEESIHGDACVIATGGLSYPSTGSTGDGYRFAKSLGHHVTNCTPSLVPCRVGESWITDLEGLSLKNVEIQILDDEKCLFRDFGEMLFTHDGVSGPLILSASSYAGEVLSKRPLTLSVDLKPALSEEQLDKRILRDFKEAQNKQFKNMLGRLLPAKLIPVVISLSGIRPDKEGNRITHEERRHLVYLLKHFRMTLTGLGGFDEAVITKGGVETKEVDPGTMESKLVKGVYFAGEVLDVDALTGGFNLQIAWSTGYTAGKSVGKDWISTLE